MSYKFRVRLTSNGILIEIKLFAEILGLLCMLNYYRFLFSLMMLGSQNVGDQCGLDLVDGPKMLECVKVYLG